MFVYSCTVFWGLTVADNAGGIAEMSGAPASCRDATDALDAAGNCTKAITKGYSIASAALACFLLFGAFMDEFEQFSGLPFRTVDIAKPEVLVGGLLGVMMVFAFAGMAVDAVGRTAPELAGAGHAVDAYGGVGLFAATVMAGAAHVTLVESSASA